MHFPKFALFAITLLACHAGKKSAAPEFESTFSGRKYGCGEVFLYKANADENRILAVTAPIHPRGDTVYTFDISSRDRISVKVYSFDRKNVLWDYFCNDIEYDDLFPKDSVAAIQGKVRIRIYGFLREAAFNTYKVDAEGEGLRWGGEGEGPLPERFRIDSVAAGWLPG
jgi:hypothetical protein